VARESSLFWRIRIRGRGPGRRKGKKKERRIRRIYHSSEIIRKKEEEDEFIGQKRLAHLYQPTTPLSIGGARGFIVREKKKGERRKRKCERAL